MWHSHKLSHGGDAVRSEHGKLVWALMPDDLVPLTLTPVDLRDVEEVQF